MDVNTKRAKKGRAFSRTKRSLAIVERAYRAPIEEQYGHILWLSRVLRKMKGEHDILLKGQAVLYARQEQINIELEIGGVHLNNLSNYKSAIESFLKEGGNVFVFQNDLIRYGIQEAPMIDGICAADEADLVTFFEEYECVWYW